MINVPRNNHPWYQKENLFSKNALFQNFLHQLSHILNPNLKYSMHCPEGDGHLSYTPKQGFLDGSLYGLGYKRCSMFNGTVAKQVAPVSLI